MNKKGYALAIILMIVVILGVLAVPLTNLMLSETKASLRLGNQTQAYYIARSGAVIAEDIMIEAINNAEYETYDGATITHSYGGGTFQVEIDVEQFYDDDEDEIKERIVLYTQSDYKDTSYDLELIMNLKESTDIQNKNLRAAMQLDNLDIDGMNNSNQGAKIDFKLVDENGDLVYLEVVEGAELPGVLEQNDFEHGKPGAHYVKNEIEDLLLGASGKVSESITNNDSDIMIIASSYESPTGKNADDLEITIDGTGDIHIFVEELNISNLKIINDNLSENTGKVNIYVLDEMYIEGDINKHLFDNLPDQDKFFNYNPLNIFYYGDTDVFAGINKPEDLFVYSNLVLVDAGIDRNRGNFTLYGDLMVGGDTVFLQPSGSEQIYINGVIYAPYTDLHITRNFTLYGGIIAKSLGIQATGMDFTYDPEVYGEIIKEFHQEIFEFRNGYENGYFK